MTAKLDFEKTAAAFAWDGHCVYGDQDSIDAVKIATARKANVLLSLAQEHIEALIHAVLEQQNRDDVDSNMSLATVIENAGAFLREVGLTSGEHA